MAVVTSNIGGIATSNIGVNSDPPASTKDVPWSINIGNIEDATNNAVTPAIIVEKYDNPVVAANNLPAPSDKSAIPLTINPTIISGIKKLRILPKIDENVTGICKINSGKNVICPTIAPNTIVKINLGIKPIDFFFFAINKLSFLFG